MDEITTLSPILQWGFAGTTLVLIVVLWWALREFCKMLRRAIEVIPQLATEVAELNDQVEDNTQLVGNVRDRMLEFRCPFRGEHTAQQPT